MEEEVTKSIETAVKNFDLSQLTSPTVIERLVEWLTASGVKLIIGIIIISIGFKLINRFVNKVLKILEKSDADATLSKFLRSLVSGGLKIALVMPVLGYWGVDLTSIAALVASAGVAIGLALQGSLSNFAGGFIILFMRPFKVGDYIQTAGYEGTVEQIDLFYTKLITIDNKVTLIPNGVLSNGSLINYSAMDTRRVDLNFGAGYECDINQVKNVLNTIINNHPLALKDESHFVGIVEHGPSSVNFGVRVWCKTEDYWTLYFDLLESVKIEFDKNDISIPYPQMDLHLIKEYENQINKK